MAKNGAREQEKRMAANNTQASKSAVDVVKNLLKETVQVAQCEGEVSNVYPKVGELVGLGSPIMSISIMSDMWGTFNVREDHLQGLNKGDEFTAYVPSLQQGNQDEGLLPEGPGLLRYLEGNQGQWSITTARLSEVKARPDHQAGGIAPGTPRLVLI